MHTASTPTPDVDTIFNLCSKCAKIPLPASIAQAEKMTAAAMLFHIGGPAAFDVVYRHRIKEVSTRQIAKDNRCKRAKVRGIVQRWDSGMATLQAAIEGKGLDAAPAVEVEEGPDDSATMDMGEDGE